MVISCVHLIAIIQWAHDCYITISFLYKWQYPRYLSFWRELTLIRLCSPLVCVTVKVYNTTTWRLIRQQYLTLTLYRDSVWATVFLWAVVWTLFSRLSLLRLVQANKDIPFFEDWVSSTIIKVSNWASKSTCCLGAPISKIHTYFTYSWPSEISCSFGAWSTYSNSISWRVKASVIITYISKRYFSVNFLHLTETPDPLLSP